MPAAGVTRPTTRQVGNGSLDQGPHLALVNCPPFPVSSPTQDVTASTRLLTLM